MRILRDEFSDLAVLETNGLAVLEARHPVRSQFTEETSYGDDEVAA
jgi:hypothetical protein